MVLPPAIATSLRRRGHRWERAESLVGDVSQRRYLRLRSERGSSRILALYPDALRDTCRRFERTTEALTRAGVRVPEILDADCASGWMLVEDLGPQTLYDRFRGEADPWSRMLPWYLEAARMAARIARLPARRASLNPPLGRESLLRELDQTWAAFLEPAGLRRDQAEGRRLDELLGAVCRRLTSESLVPCHRDFMVRNLVPLGPPGPGTLGLLDHQDLRVGPRWYDLASLLNDSLFPPESLALSVLQEQGISTGPQRRAYRRAVVQRALKAVGTFARHGAHRRLIRPTLRRALDHLEKLPESRGLLKDLPGLRRRFDLLD